MDVTCISNSISIHGKFIVSGQQNTPSTSKRTKKRSSGKRKVRTINREILASLGYRVTSQGFENKKGEMRIMRLERTDDGSTPDFCYCEHNSEDMGFIIPEPFAIFERNIRQWIAAQEAQ